MNNKDSMMYLSYCMFISIEFQSSLNEMCDASVLQSPRKEAMKKWETNNAGIYLMAYTGRYVQ